MKIHRPRGYLYPDVSAVCGGADFDHEASPPILLNPTLVAEVLSPSTESYDRGQKFELYRALSSLRECLLIDPRRVHVERYTRHGEFWLYSEITDPDAELNLESVGCSLTIAQIYADLDFGVSDDTRDPMD